MKKINLKHKSNPFILNHFMKLLTYSFIEIDNINFVFNILCFNSHIYNKKIIL